MQRESIEYDVVIVGGGPSGLSAAIRLRQLAQQNNHELSVCLLEKGSEVGAHILSGAVFEPRALNELIPDWQAQGAPLNTEVIEDQVFYFKNGQQAQRIPGVLVPKSMHNQGNYIISLGNLCRWLAGQAEVLGVEIFPGFSAASLLVGEYGEIAGVVTGDMGVNRDGSPKANFEPGMEIRGKYTLFAEGSRGHLGKQLIERYQLDENVVPQHYGLGIKELWDINPEKHQAGTVVHGTGWPLVEHDATGGFFLYHAENHQVAVGLITDLNYSNPYLSPFEEFQRFKHHPVIQKTLQGGKRVSYGARAITKGGLHSLPRQYFPGGLLIGCDAGTLNYARIKGSHTAMKSGMIAADTVFEHLSQGGQGGEVLTQYTEKFKASWLYEELYASRNFGALIHRYGTFVGGAINVLDQNIFKGKLPLKLKDTMPDHQCLKPAKACEKISYPKADGETSFDRLSSVHLSNTNHEEEQPVHLVLADSDVPVSINLATYEAPEQRYCPAGVYEILEDEVSKEARLQINAQNCVHCKTCDIKDPTQNINWVTPEGAGGPNYPNM